MRLYIIAGSALFCLGGCCTPAPAPSVCPQIVPYNAADQRALAGELQAHPDLQQVPRFIRDYAGLRGQIRACQGVKKHGQTHEQI